jgi:hypothetical protein
VAVKAELGLPDKDMIAGLSCFVYQDHKAAGQLAVEFRRKDSGAGIRPG